MRMRTRWMLLVAGLTGAVVAGCGQKTETAAEATQEAAPDQTAPAAEATEHGEAGEKMMPANTPKEVWAQIMTEQSELASAIQNGQLKDVHHLAFGIRDLVVAMAEKTTGLSSNDASVLSGLVDQVKNSASKLDELGDAGNLSGTQAEFDRLNKLLNSIKTLMGSG